LSQDMGAPDTGANQAHEVQTDPHECRHLKPRK